MYGKIFSDIFDSSIMVHGGDTVYVFIALICLADSGGYTRITIPALALRIGKPLDVVEAAIGALEKPDAHSTTPEEDGRRIISLRELTGGQENRGWWIVNYLKYREIARRQEQADKSTLRKREWRAAKNSVAPSNATLCHVLPPKATTEEGEGEGEEVTTLSDKSDIAPLVGKNNSGFAREEVAREILEFLNEKAGRRYRPVKVNLELIFARLKEGYTPDEIRMVIAKKCREWKGDETMERYLRPATLFNRLKFSQYVGELGAPK